MYERLQRKPPTTHPTQTPSCGTRLQAPEGLRSVLGLPVGSPDHPAEREADRIADRVMQSISAKQTLRPSGGSPATAPATQAGALEPSVAAAPATDLSGHLGPGQPLDQTVRAFAGPRFGFDFSRLRIHADERAAAAAEALEARAFTYGSSIAFGPGEYRPSSTDGQRLIAHELAHVLQQSTATSNAGIVQRQPAGPRRVGRILSLKEIAADPVREKARKATGQVAAKVCHSMAGADKGNCPTILAPGLQVGIVAEKAGGAWLQITPPEQIPGFGTKEPVYVMAAFVEELDAMGQLPVPSKAGGSPLKDVLRLDDTIAIKGLPENQPNYVDHVIKRLESAPLGPEIILFAQADATTGVSIPKGDFYLDDDPLKGWTMGNARVYKSRAIAEAVVADLMSQTPDTAIFTYYIEGGIIFPTTLSVTTIPNLMPFIRQQREQDKKDLEATADLAKALAWWYVGARFPIKVRGGAGASGTPGRETAKQLEKEVAKQTEKEAAKQVEKQAGKEVEKQAAREAERTAGKEAVKRVPAQQPSAPAGWKGTLNAFGKEIGWPGAGKVKIPAEAADLAKLRNAGVTEAWAVEQAKIYREVARLNPSNPSAALRAEWLEKIAARLRRAP